MMTQGLSEKRKQEAEAHEKWFHEFVQQMKHTFPEECKKRFDFVKIAWKKQREQERLRIIRSHMDLTTLSNDVEYKDLKEKLYALNGLITSAYPVVEKLPRTNKRSLFNVVLENTKLSNAEKIELTIFLFEILGYRAFYKEFFEELQFFDAIITIPEFRESLYKIYIDYAGREALPLDLEIKIWGALLKDKKYSSSLFDFILKSSKYDPESFLQFIECWLNSLNDRLAVIALYEAIVKSDYWVTRNYQSSIKKMAQLRILAIELEDKQFIWQDDKKVENFLRSSEPSFFKCCMRNPSSYQIHKMIPDEKFVTEIFSRKKERAQCRINEKIADEIGYPAHFRFR